MGYTVTTEEVSFFVPPANVEAALVTVAGSAALRGTTDAVSAHH